MVPTETIDSDDDEFDNPKTKQEAPKKISSTTKPKKAKKRRPPSEDERASDNEYVPSGNDNSDDDDDDDSNASGDNASDDEKPGPSRKRSAAPKQPAKKPRGRPSASKAGGGGGASLLCQPCQQPDEDAELIVDAAWYGSAKDVWGDAGEFVTELVMSLARQPGAPDAASPRNRPALLPRRRSKGSGRPGCRKGCRPSVRAPAAWRPAVASRARALDRPHGGGDAAVTVWPRRWRGASSA